MDCLARSCPRPSLDLLAYMKAKNEADRIFQARQTPILPVQKLTRKQMSSFGAPCRGDGELSLSIHVTCTLPSRAF